MGGGGGGEEVRIKVMRTRVYQKAAARAEDKALALDVFFSDEYVLCNSRLFLI